MMISISSRSRLVAAASPLALADGAGVDARPGRRSTAGDHRRGFRGDGGAARRPGRQPDAAGAIKAATSSSPASALRCRTRSTRRRKPTRSSNWSAPKTSASCPTRRSAKPSPACRALPSQRLSGRADVISIRGFGPDFSTTLLNGREQTSTGDNRAVQFDQYPAEIINQVNIYKTPLASVIGQGIAGTIDLRTIRPLEYGHRVISVGGRAVYPDIGKLNPDAKKYGYRVNGVYVDQFADGRAGVSLAGELGLTSRTRSRNSTPGATRDRRPGGNVKVGRRTEVLFKIDRAEASWSHGHARNSSRADNWTSTVDGFYSNFKDDQIARGIEVPLQWGGGSRRSPAAGLHR